MSADTVALLTGLLGAVGGLGGVAGLLVVPYTRRNLTSQAQRNTAEAHQLQAASAANTVEVLLRQIDKVEAMQVQLTNMRTQLTDAETRTRELIKQLDEANMRARIAEAESARLRDELAAHRARRRPPRRDEGSGTA
ncbi:hypothetical protein [Actinocatenispora rupis]|uniref:Uncharacterized protein n=1 Tax=Actinocatenispora rupis TaxID=519421 RepID=A0A8J3J2T0_9ACTN|nr:hypothetical protein [Actinocatenispora rupis]GID10531.1 hypothetical protein Aru02nite_14200 [Actinocatenispora rupis]